ncbi:MAG: NUDIX domain-containing protein [Tsuneonella sp.]
MLVVAAAIDGGAGKWLMQRRPPHKQHGGLWEFPGGKVESGEAPRAALVREL